jgi:hypothetical protein
MPANPFVGAWNLLSSEMRASTGDVIYPLGPDCAGSLLFDSSGILSAHLMRPDRAHFVSGDIVRGTDEEIRNAYQGYVAFWGRYDFDEAKRELTYVITGSLFPNWVGHTNLRYYEFTENRLTFRTPPFLMAGTELVGVLNWERVSSPQ